MTLSLWNHLHVVSSVDVKVWLALLGMLPTILAAATAGLLGEYDATSFERAVEAMAGGGER
jgi:hypothetical protein